MQTSRHQPPLTADFQIGSVFEKRLIEAYIAENGKDPVTGDELSTDELIEVKTQRVVRPRPPTLTSIPSLLSVFQEEWDALALETFTLRQTLAQTRQELSAALYQHDAAVRVIARLTKERDELATRYLRSLLAQGLLEPGMPCRWTQLDCLRRFWREWRARRHRTSTRFIHT